LDIEKVLKDNSGIALDIACGPNKQPGFVGLDIQAMDGVDIIWDVNCHPWPLPDECVVRALASHIVEHIPPVMVINGRTTYPFLEFMDEVWRVVRVGGEFAISCPHGSAQSFLQDPTHCHPINEATWAYFDPEHSTQFYNFYRPKPWKITYLVWSPVSNVEVILKKRALSNE
jgi:hypothetical protein